MDFDRVEGLLTLVREDQPFDDGFTKIVMSKVQPSRLQSFKRFVTRPMILAAATLMIGSAAVAAIQQTEVLRPASNNDKLSTGALSRPLPSQGSSSTESSEESRKDSSTATENPGAMTASKAGGYLSSHAAFLSNGRLRLETETFANSVQTGAPHDIVLTLENLTDERLVVSGPKDCVLEANVYSENSGNKTQLTFCPGRSRPAEPSSELELLVLEPHQKVAREITIFLPEKGGWFVTGLCSCSDDQSLSGEIEPAPLLQGMLPVPRGQVSSIEIGEPTLSGYRQGRLATPQIRMEAK